jgi:hypothetical protein
VPFEVKLEAIFIVSQFRLAYIRHRCCLKNESARAVRHAVSV